MPVGFEMDLEQPAIRQTRKGLEIRVRVTPNSSQESVWFGADEGLVVKLKSPPVEGRANKELIRIISGKLGVAPTRITVCKGLTSRNKTVLVQDLSDVEAIKRLKSD